MLLPPGARILLVPASFAPKFGGLETAVAHLAAELARRGFQVHVLTNRYPRNLPGFERIKNIPVHRVLMTDIIPTRAQIPRLGKYLLGVAIAPIQLARVAALIHHLNPTIINAHYLGVPAAYTRFANIFSASKFVLSVHGSDLSSTPYPSGSKGMSQTVANAAQAWTACSNSMAHYLQVLMPDSPTTPVFVTGNGVDPSELQSSERFENPRPYLFAAAHFTPKKGLDVLLHAMRNVLDAGLEIDLILAGSGPLEGHLRGLTVELRMEKYVRFWGVASRRDMAALLNGCILFVLPSLWEAFGIVGLEAMVCEKAVVASRCGGIPEVVRDNETGLLVPPGDADALSRATIKLLREPERRAAMARRGCEVAMNEFSWSTVTDRYLQAYEVALRG